ncbi:hypothetical protein BU15DRAFT_75729 [Melanogaster broomeanus]|nr:hypothetical protein BU15DRAFT_75729 [Melanogaster broomeanus]
MGSTGFGMESAPTPRMLGGDEDDSSTPMWLIDPAFQGKKVMMEITGTLGGWHGGELDGLKGYVTNIFRSSNDILVTIEHLDPGRVGTNVEVPVVYLSSVHPDQMGDHARPLEGPARGTPFGFSPAPPPVCFQPCRPTEHLKRARNSTPHSKQHTRRTPNMPETAHRHPQ